MTSCSAVSQIQGFETFGILSVEARSPSREVSQKLSLLLVSYAPYGLQLRHDHLEELWLRKSLDHLADQ